MSRDTWVCAPLLLIKYMLHAADDAVAKLGMATGHPERLAALAVDISSPDSIEAAAQTLERDFAGKLCGLINNAAVRGQCSVLSARCSVPSCPLAGCNEAPQTHLCLCCFTKGVKPSSCCSDIRLMWGRCAAWV